MMQATNVIRDKPEWWIKFKDEGIWRKWMEELAPALEDDEITPDMEQFMKDELAYVDVCYLFPIYFSISRFF